MHADTHTHVHGHHDHGPGTGHDHDATPDHDARDDHGPGQHHPDHHNHYHHRGLRGLIGSVIRPHSHDSADSVDPALEASTRGIRAVKVSLVALAGTAGLQAVVVLASGSVALLADTVHNFSDALTAVPLWVAFALSRRPATRRYTYGFGRAEDLAGLFVVAMIAISALVAGFEAVRRLIEPQPIEQLGWVAVAGVIGFLGNEGVAVYRIRVGRRIGSAALVADGLHARTDGLTSLAVVLGAFGVALGLPWADPVSGLLIAVAIGVMLVSTSRDVFRRLLDGVDPVVVDRTEGGLRAVPGVLAVRSLRIRWIGHTLRAEADVEVAAELSLGQAHAIAHDAEQRLFDAVPRLAGASVHVSPAGAHAVGA